MTDLNQGEPPPGFRIIGAPDTHHERAHDHAAQVSAYDDLIERLNGPAADPLTALCQSLVASGIAPAAAVSRVDEDGAHRLRWVASAGSLRPRTETSSPLPQESIATALESGETILMQRDTGILGESFGELAEQALLVPLAEKKGHPYLIWAITSEDSLAFDAEDARQIAALGRVANSFLACSSKTERSGAKGEAERRLRHLVEGIPQLVWSATDAGDRDWSSPQWLRYTGQSQAETLGRGWADAIHPEDRVQVLALWEAAENSGRFECDYRLRNADGSYRWFQSRAQRLIDGDARGFDEWLGTSTDIEEMHRLQQHQQHLLHELQHRVRNTLSIIRSIARRTAENSTSASDMAAHFMGRLDAFSRVQSILARNPTGGVDFANLISQELLIYAVQEGGRLQMAGPPVALPSKPAELLSLMVHELATNAVKFGALSDQQGRIEIVWDIERRDGAPWLLVEWLEYMLVLSNTEIAHSGFGMELFERTLPYDLGAETEIDLTKHGLRFRMEMPLPPLGQ